MKHTLILLKDGRNILVTDEKDNALTKLTFDNISPNYVYNNGEIRDLKYAHNRRIDDKKIIAGIEPLSILTYSDEVKQILKDKYGWIDIESIVELSQEATDNLKFAGGKHEEIVAQIFYRKGFKAHQSITNKMFSLEDMKKCFFHTYQNTDRTAFNEFIQSLQQPIQLDVEIEQNEDLIKIIKLLE